MSSVLADAAANLVWGAYRNRGLIAAFSPSDNSLHCALSLPRDYLEATHDIGRYVMARAGNMLCLAVFSSMATVIGAADYLPIKGSSCFHAGIADCSWWA